MNIIWVFIGGGLGSICRYGIARWLAGSDYTFPLATFLANTVSCIILGLLIGLSLREGLSQQYRLFLMTGFCGGFSTFSTFSAETFQLIHSGHYTHAFANVLFSLILCLFCIYLGIKIVNN